MSLFSCGYMQGGIVSAAIDNTVGPLSMLVAPPSVTRKKKVKYLVPVGADVDFIYVTARFLEQKKRLLYFEASVDDDAKTIKYATAGSTHWVF
jgi:acyl-coenzyme A thioesterase PaaI-like protein